MRPFTAIAALIAPLLAATGLRAEDKPAQPAQPAKPYPLTTCAIAGEPLGSMGDPYVFVHEGREIKLCCKGCLKKFNADPAAAIKRVDEQAAKTAPKP